MGNRPPKIDNRCLVKCLRERIKALEKALADSEARYKRVRPHSHPIDMDLRRYRETDYM